LETGCERQTIIAPSITDELNLMSLKTGGDGCFKPAVMGARVVGFAQPNR